MSRPNKKLEDMTLEELEKEFSRAVKGVEFRELNVKDGAILLDPNNPSDREWYENDEAYDYN